MPAELHALFARSKTEPYEPMPFVNSVMELFKLGVEAPWAWFGMRGEGFKVPSAYWFKLEIQTSTGAFISDPRLIKAIAEDFAREFSFAENSIISRNGGWYLAVSSNKQVKTTPIWSLRAGHVERSFGLHGVDNMFWFERFNEASRWLFSHPLNRQRIESGLPIMEIIFPWGTSGYIPFAETPRFSALFSDSPIFRGLGNHLGMAAFPRIHATADLSQTTINHKNICIIEDSLRLATYTLDYQQWSDQLEKILLGVIQPCLEAVRDGMVQDLYIDDGYSQVLHYSKGLKLILKKNKYKPFFQDYPV